MTRLFAGTSPGNSDQPGLLLLPEVVNQHRLIRRLISVLQDPLTPILAQHKLDTRIRQRVFGAAAGYDMGQLAHTLKGTEVGVSINNLTNERYYSCFDSANCWFGEERTVEASVAYSF